MGDTTYQELIHQGRAIDDVDIIVRSWNANVGMPDPEIVASDSLHNDRLLTTPVDELPVL